MITKAIRLIAVFSFMVLLSYPGNAWATTITMDIESTMDGRYQLIIRHSTMPWDVSQDTAVGRHKGRNEPAAMIASTGGNPERSGVEPIRPWPGFPPRELRWEDISAMYSELREIIPQSERTVFIPGVSRQHIHPILERIRELYGHSTIDGSEDDPAGVSSLYPFNLSLETHEMAVPEPATMFLIGTGLIAISVLRRRIIRPSNRTVASPDLNE